MDLFPSIFPKARNPPHPAGVPWANPSSQTLPAMDLRLQFVSSAPGANRSCFQVLLAHEGRKKNEPRDRVVRKGMFEM